MAWKADGTWSPETTSVATKLDSLLSSDSQYIKAARASGTQQAAKRGLLNSSIAAGAAETAAITAALPIASQDAQAIENRNQASLEGSINLNNSTKLQEIQGNQAKELANINNQAEALRQKEAAGYQLTAQEAAAKQDLEKQAQAIASSDRQALLAAETSRSNAETAAKTDLTSSYLSSVASLSGNSKLKAKDRNAYIAELQRVTGVSAAAQTSVATNARTLTW